MKLLRKCLLFFSILYSVFCLQYPKNVLATDKNGIPISAYYFNYWAAPWGNQMDWNSFVVWNQPSSTVPPVLHNTNLLDPGREPWRRQIRSGDNVTYPLIGPYDSSNPEIIKWQIANAKNAGIDAFAIAFWGDQFNKTTKASEDTVDKRYMWWIAEHYTIPTIENENFGFYILNDASNVASTCDYAISTCDGYTLADFAFTTISGLNMATELTQAGITQQRFADVALNAYSALSKWKNSPGYLHVDNKPVYFFQPLIDYRDAPAKLNTAFRLTEKLLGLPDHGIYWFGADGYVQFNHPTDQPSAQWTGIIDGIVDGGLITSTIYQSESEGQSRNNEISAEIKSHNIDWIPALQTSFIKTYDTATPPILDASLNPWYRRQNGATFSKSIREVLNVPATIPRKMYFLYSWNATYLEGYTVEPAAIWDNDNCSGYTATLCPYKYLDLLYKGLVRPNGSSATFTPAPLPPAADVDPCRWVPLGYYSTFDINRDNKIDLLDLAKIINKRLSPSFSITQCAPENLNNDQLIDNSDLQLFLSQYTHL